MNFCFLRYIENSYSSQLKFFNSLLLSSSKLLGSPSKKRSQWNLSYTRVIYAFSKQLSESTELYSCAPHMTKISSISFVFDKNFIHELRSENQIVLFSTSSPFWEYFEEIIQLNLQERGLYDSGIDSHVFLHMMTAFFFLESIVFDVISLKYFISSGIFHARSLFFPSQFSLSTASMIENFFIKYLKNYLSNCIEKN